MKWIKKKLGIPNKKHLELKGELPHFIFQKDFYSIAWGLKHHGYYLTSEGIKYAYEKPSDWNFYEILNLNAHKEKSFGSDKLSFISCDKLLENLSHCKISSWSTKIEKEKIIPVIDELTNADLITVSSPKCDSGLHSRSILVLDNLNNTYMRVLLECQGDAELELDSDKKKIIYDIFK